MWHYILNVAIPSRLIQLLLDTRMKIIEIPVNTLVELQFNYIGVRHKLRVGLLYKSDKAVYVSAIRNAGKTIPAFKLTKVVLVYRTSVGIYSFNNVELRSISYNGQNLYVVQTDQEAVKVNHRNAHRVSIGVNVATRIITTEGSSEINCILKDISMTGMGLLSRHKIDPLAKIEISFRFNDSIETLVGSIVRTYEFKNSKGYFYGCEFDTPNAIIGQYVARQMEMIN